MQFLKWIGFLRPRGNTPSQEFEWKWLIWKVKKPLQGVGSEAGKRREHLQGHVFKPDVTEQLEFNSPGGWELV